jgi:hypothetical protein
MGNGAVYQPKGFIIGLTWTALAIKNSYLGFYERKNLRAGEKPYLRCPSVFDRRFCMKWAVLVLALALGGCATVADIRQTPPTMSVISGKTPQDYALCVTEKLAGSRGALQVEPHRDGVWVIVPQKLSSGPAALFDIEERSGGSSIKLFESMSNVPMRPRDIRNAATQCISG